jgi:hypothetical protein
MPKSSRKSNLERVWSKEEIRQRGVCAVIAAMRLNEEHRRLSLEHAYHVEETRILTEYLEQIRSLNQAARELIKRRNGQDASNTKTRNTWMNNGYSHLRNGSSSKGT